MQLRENNAQNAVITLRYRNADKLQAVAMLHHSYGPQKHEYTKLQSVINSSAKCNLVHNDKTLILTFSLETVYTSFIHLNNLKIIQETQKNIASSDELTSDDAI